MKNIKILGFQLKVNLDCNERNEYLIEDKYLIEQIESAKEIISEKDSDIIIFPEMCYIESLHDYYTKISNNRLVIAGSIYIDGINYTVIYQNGVKNLVKKYNASGAEPMIRNQKNISTKKFIKQYLDDHTFIVKKNKIVVLNCMEYYQHAYRIARENPDIFAIICICSNSNQKVFLEETKALHNHCENTYSFVLNCISTYMGKEYAKGGSYIFGPIQYHEQDWLKKEGINMENHSCAILTLNDEAGYFYGEFSNYFSRFGRSDNYINNPQNIKLGKLRSEEKMKKNIIITSGPTNERMDAVMKITNMSTGALGATVADEFIKNEADNIDNLYYLSPKLARKPQIESSKIKLIQIESAKDLLEELKNLLINKKIDAVVHSSAVGDYTGKYAITASMLAQELADKCYMKNLSREKFEELILNIIRNPENIVSDEHKISSYEPDLMFKLDLTPKVIGEIKKVSPDTRLFGFKLLDGVPHEELIEIACKLRKKNSAEYIIANDLSTIKKGVHPAYFVGENGVDYTCNDKFEIAKTLRKIIFKEDK